MVVYVRLAGDINTMKQHKICLFLYLTNFFCNLSFKSDLVQLWGKKGGIDRSWPGWLQPEWAGSIQPEWGHLCR